MKTKHYRHYTIRYENHLYAFKVFHFCSKKQVKRYALFLRRKGWETTLRKGSPVAYFNR